MKVRLTEYDDKWIQMFEEEVNLVKLIFGEEIITFEHFGSTSVPGMKAKPVIDMMCIVKDINKIDSFNEKMNSLGYDVAGEWGLPGRRLFRKGGENRSHHIHFYQFDNPQIHRHLIFRDYLRSHPDEVELYTNLKVELAERFDDTSFYSQAKKPFVKEMENRALQWHSNKNQ
ncbi:GrpB family protein [Paenibacillus sp. FSL R5-0407]|uniref:GrpB family protein n=1 Tax=Paenibacillus sp. FSL R5-0407 TaxID=2975320 RepID=UPI0030F7D5B0